MMNEEKDRLLAVIREFYGRVVWTHKTHEKERELSTRRANIVKWINVVLMALTTTGILASIPLNSVWASVAAAILGSISTGFAIYKISFSPEIRILAQRHAAKDLLIERDRLLLLIERCMASGADLERIRQEIQATVDRVGQIYKGAPDTSSKAYSMATEGLKYNEELTFAPGELDLLLPKALRLESMVRDSSQGSAARLEDPELLSKGRGAMVGQ